MAVLNLLPRKEFEIILNDESKVTGRFSYWAEKRFCEKKGLTLTGYGAVYSPENVDKLTFDDIVLPVMCAVEYVYRSEKKPFDVTDIAVCDWLEQLENSEVTRLISHFLVSEENRPAAPEKKRETAES